MCGFIKHFTPTVAQHCIWKARLVQGPSTYQALRRHCRLTSGLAQTNHSHATSGWQPRQGISLTDVSSCPRLDRHVARIIKPDLHGRRSVTLHTASSSSGAPAVDVPNEESTETGKTTGHHHHHHQALQPSLAPAEPWNLPSAQKEGTSDGRKSGVVIVGGGPAGLGAAMMLAARGWTGITVVEKNDSLTYTDPDRAYVYMIDGRGLKLLSKLGLEEALSRKAVPLAAADIMRVAQDGSVKVQRIPIKADVQSYWLPRPAFMRMLEEDGLGGVGQMEGWGRNITVLTGSSVSAVEKELTVSKKQQKGLKESIRLKVTIQDKQGRQRQLTPKLVIGADGVNSLVRNTLVAWDNQDSKGTTQLSKFERREFKSPAGGIRFKVMRLPSNPALSIKPGSPAAPNPSICMVMANMKLPDSKRVRLGLLPNKDLSSPRTGNMMTCPEGHKLWEVKDAEGLYKYLEETLPQFNARALLPIEEADRFAKSQGGRFSHPYHVESLQYVCGSSVQKENSLTETSGMTTAGNRNPSAGDEQISGVVLLGDARAAFPPDLGQGVNSALEDIAELEQALDDCDDSLEKTLPLYESRRLPDITALIQLQTFSNPYQYQVYKYRSFFWTVNFAFRMLLNKLAPNWFHRPSFLLIQDFNLRYSQVLEMAHTTTKRIQAMLLAMLCAAVGVVFLNRPFPVAA